MPRPAQTATDHGAKYFILADFGSGTAWIERATGDMDRATTIRDLITMQVDHPLQVWAAEDGRWHEVTEDICREIADWSSSKGEPLNRVLIEWIESNTSVTFARALKAA